MKIINTIGWATPWIRRMIGYSIHPPFVGQVDGLHPLRLLEEQT